MFRTPNGVRLIKSKFVYKLKKDWTGKVIKRKSRLVVLGCLQREGIDYEETFAPVAKVTTFRLILEDIEFKDSSARCGQRISIR